MVDVLGRMNSHFQPSRGDLAIGPSSAYTAAMRNLLHFTTTLFIVAALTVSLSAQTRDGVMGELLKDVADLEKKVLDLAKAIPESAYAWSPGPGVRSTGEVFVHIAADNYFLPVLLGTPAPAFFCTSVMTRPLTPFPSSGRSGALVSATSTSPLGST